MTTTPERLQQLIRGRESYSRACRATGSPVAAEESEEIAAALRELESLRAKTDALLAHCPDAECS
jgi:hypothetical protein